MLCGGDVVTLKSDPVLIFQTTVHVKISYGARVQGVEGPTSRAKTLNLHNPIPVKDILPAYIYGISNTKSVFARSYARQSLPQLDIVLISPDIGYSFLPWPLETLSPWALLLYRIRHRPKSRRFVQPKHEIHVLDRLTGGPFHQVVDGGQQNQALGGCVQLESNVTKIGSPDMG